MPPPPARPRRDGWKFRWDIVLLVSFVAAAMRRTTDLPLHEVLGVMAVPVLAVHLWLNWSWIVDVLRRSASALPGEVRFNRAWDIAQAVVTLVAVVSGLAASRHLLPALGVTPPRNRFMEDIHAASAWSLMVMIGIHLGVHAHWIWPKVRKPRLLLTVALLSLVAWSATRLDVVPLSREFSRRLHNDSFRLALALIPPALFAFGCLVVLRRRGKGNRTQDESRKLRTV